VEDCLKCPRYANTADVASQQFESCICPDGSTVSQDQLRCECEAGKYMTADSLCESCPSGRYSGVIGIESVQECENCPTYFDPNTPGITDVTQCVCPARSSAVESNYESCQCDVGYYMEQNECVECPQGRYGTHIGNVRLRECLVCPRFSFTNEAGSEQFESCLCPPRSTISEDKTRCECEVGNYMDLATQECKLCDVGRFNTMVGAESYADCTVCPKFSTTVAAGSSSVEQCICPAESFRDTNGEECQCIPGSLERRCCCAVSLSVHVCLFSPSLTHTQQVLICFRTVRTHLNVINVHKDDIVLRLVPEP
jgi:hypothetical protein